ncbi:hypothetical protein [Pseudomonas fluorescens]|uniref:Uncharacterized protein n=1 Tax=Pseudomonas fluorescens TaxID=294 RepID=A0A423LVD5_PSEFL|nr:hypothetical protein [Pseudomonas fluorescens]RON72276.1 hypothetical protein BK671_00010 [Pseudomonas fluorescens]
MGNSSERVIEALRIKEANGLEISLKDIVSEATAIVPRFPDREYPRDTIVIKVGDNQTARIGLGPIPDRTYEFKVPKAWMLDHAGTGKKLQFSYIFYSAGLNAWRSEPIDYTISH